LSLPHFDEYLFHNVLDIFNVRRVPIFTESLDERDLNPLGKILCPLAIMPYVDRLRGFENGVSDFRSFIGHAGPVSLDNPSNRFHESTPCAFYSETTLLTGDGKRFHASIPLPT
jgi:hypothetical protein